MLDELMKEKHVGEQNTVVLFAVVSQVLLQRCHLQIDQYAFT